MLQYSHSPSSLGLTINPVLLEGDRQPTLPIGILVVDDDMSLRAMLKSILECHGFRVLLATDGQTAINIYRNHRGEFGVIVLDVHNPKLEGAATLEALHELEPEFPACFMNSTLDVDGADQL